MANNVRRNWVRAFVTRDFDRADAIIDGLTDDESEDFHTFVTAFFSLMLQVRFGENTSREAIHEFVEELRYDYRNAEPAIKPLMVEAVIRAACGEEHLFEEIPMDELAGAQFMVIGKVSRESAEVNANLDSYIARAERLADEYVPE